MALFRICGWNFNTFANNISFIKFKTIEMYAVCDINFDFGHHRPMFDKNKNNK